MARVNNISTAVQNVKTLEDLRRYVASALDAIVAQFNGKLDFGDNIRSFGPVSILVNSAAPTKVIHGLGRVPQGYIATSMDIVNVLTTPDKTLYPWTSTQLFVQGLADGTVEILIF